jgi:hypothetical protein
MSCQQLAIVLLSCCYAVGLTCAETAQAESEVPTTETPDQWEHQLSFTIPLSARTEISVSQVFIQVERSTLSWSSVHLLLSHKLTSETLLGISPSLAIDYERATDQSVGNVIVSQLALNNRRGQLSFTLTPLHEYSWAPGDFSSHCIGLDGCALHAFRDRLSVGIESHWKADLNHNEPTVDDFYVVPVANFSSGALSYSLGLAMGLNDGSGEPLVRFSLGMSL